MTDRLLDKDLLIAEEPLSYSELICALYDLEIIRDSAAVENARAAYMRAQAGPSSDESWMNSDGTAIWSESLGKLERLLGIANL